MILACKWLTGLSGPEEFLEMFVCDKREDCPFYAKLKQKLGLAFFCLNEYCHGANFYSCSIYMLMAKGEEVPEGVLPSSPIKDRGRKGTTSSGKIRKPSGESPFLDSSDEEVRRNH